MRKFFSKYCGLLAFLAFVFTIVTANSTCVYTLYQEDMPEQAKKLRKF